MNGNPNNSGISAYLCARLVGGNLSCFLRKVENYCYRLNPNNSGDGFKARLKEAQVLGFVDHLKTSGILAILVDIVY